VTVVACNEGAQTFAGFDLTIFSEPDPGNYASDLFGGGGSALQLIGFGPGGFITFGTITIDSRENGKISGSFITRGDIVPVLEVTFVVNDPNN